MTPEEEQMAVPFVYHDGPRTMEEHLAVWRGDDPLTHEGLRHDDHTLHVAFFASDTMGCGYYRAFQPARLLQGTTQPIVAYPTFVADKLLIDWAHVLVWERTSSPAVLAAARAIAHRRVQLYDLDDDVFGVPPENPAYAATSNPAYAENVRGFLAVAEHVLTTNAVLGERLGRPFTVVPNAVDPERFVRQENETDVVRVGWAGSTSHAVDLRVIADALRQLVREFGPRIQLVTMGYDGGALLEGLPVEHHPFTPVGAYAGALAALRLDIGLAPLADIPFNHAKSPIKYAEYSALGIPTVASAVGPYTVITHGETGLLASHGQDFYRKLRRLVLDRALRRQLGEAARAFVLEEYGPDRVRTAYEDLLLAKAAQWVR